MINSIGELATTAHLLRLAINEKMLPNRDNIVICLPLDDALKIHEECVSVAPGSDQIQVLVRMNSRPDFPDYRTFTMDKPSVPEPAGEPWLVFFEIEVFVV